MGTWSIPSQTKGPRRKIEVGVWGIGWYGVCWTWTTFEVTTTFCSLWPLGDNGYELKTALSTSPVFQGIALGNGTACGGELYSNVLRKLKDIGMDSKATMHVPSTSKEKVACPMLEFYFGSFRRGSISVTLSFLPLTVWRRTKAKASRGWTKTKIGHKGQRRKKTCR